MSNNGSDELPTMSFDEALTRFIRVDLKKIKSEKNLTRSIKKSSSNPPKRATQQ